MLATIVSEFLLILVLVLANGVFAMSEIAIVSARRGRLQKLADRGHRGAGRALKLLGSPDRFLSTVQIGITLIGVFAGAYGGATVAEEIEGRLATVPTLAPWSEAIGVGAVVLVITYLSLVLGELVPKRLALQHPERIAAFTAPWMHQLSRLTAPAVHLLSGSTRAVLALLRVRPSGEPAVSDEDLRLLLYEGALAGTIRQDERAIVERVFRLGDRSVSAVMTPRVELETLDVRKPIEELRRIVARSPHRTFPAVAERLDEVLGIIHAKDLLTTDGPDAATLARPPLYVPASASALDLLDQFRKTRNHVAIVRDAFGGLAGMVTPTDILEALVGELPGPTEEEPSMLQRADGSWSFDAGLDVEEVRVILGIPTLPGQKETGYQTIAGYLIQRLGRIPRIGDAVVVAGHRFEILDMDGRRVDRILAERLQEEPLSAMRGEG